jgi:queuine tRNA-ribosyltransferase
MEFRIDTKDKYSKARVGQIQTEHGVIDTPAFIVVGTKATVKALTVEQVSGDVGALAVLANTYHLYLQPGHDLVNRSGGLGKFMNWSGPTFTDSGGFQVFSLGVAYGTGATKLAKVEQEPVSPHEKLAKIDEDGVTFTSIIDGTSHRFTPERSIEIQHAIGADIIFAFDECTSPSAKYEYQKSAMDRTHRWAERCIKYHRENNQKNQALWGVIQGGRHKDLRRESARVLGGMNFDGFGIGGSFDKDDIATAVGWVTDELQNVGAGDKPRHLLGIGEPEDLWSAVEAGIDTFDCVAPTRNARNGTFYTSKGKINIMNAKFVNDLDPIDKECDCSTCKKYSLAYIAHLFRSKEMLAGTLASIHNLHFIVGLVKKIRQSIIDGTFKSEKEKALRGYGRLG